MKIRFIILLTTALFIITSCATPPHNIGIYAYDMLYACECPRYKVFRIDPLPSVTAQLKDRSEPLDITNKDQALADEIEKAINKPGNKNLIGRDLELTFNNSQIEKTFDQQVGTSPICYIYYFEGYLTSKQTFVVEKYQLMLKSPDCISEIQD